MRQKLLYSFMRIFTIGVLLTLVACGGSEADTPLDTAVESTTVPAEESEVTPAADDAETVEHVDEAPPAVDDTGATEQQFPDIVGAEILLNDDGTFAIDVTVSSPYDTPERYADAWRVLGPDGEELAVRELAHDHQNEQPFTRSLSNVAIPEAVDVVTIQGRDQEYGYGGRTLEVEVPRE
ncbi:MAG: hypothetical protein GFH27_549279n199 [Chloroflexi bacterium AL-W]|nr:hypothetical protein [Chloroflexi bacterium AL-N1]NOK65165.1 hypothetical protein [Chloroflexi bacterium AL-N10]NOK72569.1 hypothetical protein [Chloroflexi bacterium AL-N5]NOK79344.1 hypothetical protein [Chloroflexi bacterium AL-W]NOK87260.1 hypothetical protein [Chloroflexi bacterium AL-N15]